MMNELRVLDPDINAFVDVDLSYIEDIERRMLVDALRKARYNKTRAAELLGISFRSLRYKLKKFDID